MKKLIVLLTALSLVLLMSFTVLADARVTADDPPKAPPADFTPGSLIVAIVDNTRISKADLQNPSAVFPGVDILSIRDLTDFSNSGLGISSNKQILCVVLAADSLNGMWEAMKVLEQNPLVKYISVNMLVKRSADPKELTAAFSKDMDGVVLTVETEKTQYSYDEIISVKATVKNNREEPVTIYSPHSGKIFFNVDISKDGSNIIHLINRETFGLGFAAVVIPLIIPPGEEYSQTLTYETWHSQIDGLELAPVGDYKVKAALWYWQEAVEFEIAIKPETLVEDFRSTLITVDGNLLYQDSDRAATVELYDSEENLVNYIPTTDSAYTLTARPGGGYTMVVKKPGYLSYTIKNLTLTADQDIKTIDIQQLAGDIDGDGYINSVDLTCLLSEYGRAPIIYPNADIDGDGMVNSVDLTCLLAGYGGRNVVTIND